MATRQVPEPVSSPPVAAAAGGRDAQRRRTRRAIVDAARSLILAGDLEPGLDAVAAAAEVSRRTIYMHFATLDQLLLDATLGALSDAYVDTALADAGADVERHGPDVHARLDALIDAVLDGAPRTLPLGRRILALTVNASEESADRTPSDRQRRGQRRTAWLETVVEPIKAQLDQEQVERLVSGLSMVIGFEAMVVLRDIRGLDAAAEARATRWAAHALVDAALAESGRQDRR